MGEILGLGLTHYPRFLDQDENMSVVLKAILKDPGLPEHYRTPDGWPEPMRQEWGNDEGRSAARRHREACFAQIRKQRAVLDEFKPDFIVLWGDDQYENFKEDIIPAFCVLAYDGLAVQPWAERGPLMGPYNPWDEPADKTFLINGHRAGGKYLAGGLLEEGFDIAYAYKPLHHKISHAFLNTILFLDVDRTGFDHPVVPFSVNCYGKRVIAQRGFIGSLANPLTEADFDPPSPTPQRCFDLGAATARVLARSPWRVALIASSSWSHAFLTPKHYYLYPDIEADRAYYEALVAGDYEKWRNTTTAEIEERGHQELLNWFCLVGAMAELGRRPDEADLVQTYIFNSSKCFATFRP